MNATGGNDAPLRKAAQTFLIVCAALLTQFMFGMVVNLFVTISSTHPGAGVANYFIGAAESVGWAITRVWPYLAIHALLGLALVVGSLTNLVLTLVARRPSYILAWTLVNAFGVLLAAGNGMYFLIHPDVDAASMLMATGFALGIGAVIVLLYLNRRAG